MAEDTRLPEDVVEAVLQHMNADHGADALLICRGLGGEPEAEEASTVGLDTLGIDFVATVQGAPRAVRLPWSEPIVRRVQIREEVVRMYREACTALGIEPRQPDERR